jgi:hypothetical protein
MLLISCVIRNVWQAPEKNINFYEYWRKKNMNPTRVLVRLTSIIIEH